MKTSIQRSAVVLTAREGRLYEHAPKNEKAEKRRAKLLADLAKKARGVATRTKRHVAVLVGRRVLAEVGSGGAPKPLRTSAAVAKQRPKRRLSKMSNPKEAMSETRLRFWAKNEAEAGAYLAKWDDAEDDGKNLAGYSEAALDTARKLLAQRGLRLVTDDVGIRVAAGKA